LEPARFELADVQAAQELRVGALDIAGLAPRHGAVLDRFAVVRIQQQGAVQVG
jgi:hypothetical protein